MVDPYNPNLGPPPLDAGESDSSALAPDAAPTGDNQGWDLMPDLPAATEKVAGELADGSESAAAPPDRDGGRFVVVGLAALGGVVVLGLVIAVWLNSDARLRARLAGSWEARTDSIILKLRFAPDTDNRGQNLTLNIMPTHVTMKKLSLSLPDVVPSVHGVWKVREGRVVLRFDKIDHPWAWWAVPLLEAATGHTLLHEELVLSVTRVDDSHLVLTNGLTFERSGR